MHDVVRDYVINQHTEEALRALQNEVVGAILAARPEPGGFPIGPLCPPASFEAYAARYLNTHLAGAMEAGEDPRHEWVLHPDTAVKAQVVLAVGVERIAALSETWEVAGELSHAAHAAWCAAQGRMPTADHVEILFRCASLLPERVGDGSIEALEMEILNRVSIVDQGSDRHAKVIERRGRLLASKGETFESYWATSSQILFESLRDFNWYGNDLKERDLEKGLKRTLEYGELRHKAGLLAENEAVRSFFEKGGQIEMIGRFIPLSCFEAWDPEYLGHSEESFLEMLDVYTAEVSEFLHTNCSYDFFVCGGHLSLFGLFYMNLDGARRWSTKVLEVWGDRFKSSETMTKYGMEMLMMPEVGALLVLNMKEEASAMLKACGYSMDAAGIEKIEANTQAVKRWSAHVDEEAPIALLKLLVFVCDDAGAEQADNIDFWLPSEPEAVIELYRKYPINWVIQDADFINLGAMAYLKLGRDDAAYELAKLAVDPTLKPLAVEKGLTLVICHSVLGQVAAKRGDLEEADGHFANALNEAKLSRLPMLEVIAARDWKRHLLDPNGRDTSAAEAVIDGACAKAKKTRADIGRVLLG